MWFYVGKEERKERKSASSFLCEQNPLAFQTLLYGVMLKILPSHRRNLGKEVFCQAEMMIFVMKKIENMFGIRI
jgi:hypothetical protein